MNEMVHRASGVIMGGPWSICHLPRAGIAPHLVVQSALAALSKIDLQMSPFKSHSDLARLNRAPTGTWVSLPTEMVTVMQCAQAVAAASGGALDITLGAEIEAWGFGRHPVPSTAPRAQVRPPALWELVGNQVRKKAPMNFNLCALAKGYAVDCAAQAVAALGIESFLIEAAGEVYAQGTRPDGSAWQVGLELPVSGQRLVCETLALDAQAVATSGSYRKYREIAGQTYAHTLNPRNGIPVDSDLLAVSVVAADCMHADAWATAYFVLGAEAGSALAARQKKAARWMLKTADGLCELCSEVWHAQVHTQEIKASARSVRSQENSAHSRPK